jgi:leader peptidase (prepilin peptidase) / N-methyltransferase
VTADPLLLGSGLVVGGVYGLAADRLAARWPAHADGSARRLDWRTAAIVLASAVTLALLLDRWPGTQDRVVLGIYLGALMVLAATDLDQKLLPDVITLPLIPFALVMVVLGIDPLLAGKDLALVSALAAGIGAPLLLLLTDRLFGGALGMGDVKLAVSLGLMCGVSRLLAGFLLASIAGAAVLLVLIGLRRISLRSAVPFGPVLIAAGVIGALLP